MKLNAAKKWSTCDVGQNKCGNYVTVYPYPRRQCGNSAKERAKEGKTVKMVGE